MLSHMNNKSQADKFREAAKELETDNDEKRFDENIKKIAHSVPEEGMQTRKPMKRK